MIVKELKQAIQGLPDDMDVVIQHPYRSLTNFRAVYSVDQSYLVAPEGQDVETYANEAQFREHFHENIEYYLKDDEDEPTPEQEQELFNEYKENAQCRTVFLIEANDAGPFE